MTFVRLGDMLVPESRIVRIDASHLEREGRLLVFVENAPSPMPLSGADAVDLVMRLAPCFLEGKRFRWLRSRWAAHNLLGHPLLQLFAWLGLTRAGLRVHDSTIPHPQSGGA